eukprot:g13909.t1
MCGQWQQTLETSLQRRKIHPGSMCQTRLCSNPKPRKRKEQVNAVIANGVPSTNQTDVIIAACVRPAS